MGAISLVAPVVDDTATRPPAEVPLTRTTLVCPAALPGAGTVSVASATGGSGEVTTRLPAEDTLALDGTARVATGRPVVLQADGDLAAGLVARPVRRGRRDVVRPAQPGAVVHRGRRLGRARLGPRARQPRPRAGGRRRDRARSRRPGRRPRDARRHRARGTHAALRPRRRRARPVDLSLHVVVSRGRLGAHVVDLVDELGRGARSRDWLPPQAAPATTSYLVGLGGKPGDRVLAVANPGDDEVRVALRVVTQESEFTPSRLDEITVPPGATTSVDLTGVLQSNAARGAIGLRLDSTLPVTASLRTLASGDLSHAVAGRAARRPGRADPAPRSGAAGPRRRRPGRGGDLRAARPAGARGGPRAGRGQPRRLAAHQAGPATAPSSTWSSSGPPSWRSWRSGRPAWRWSR